MDVVTDDSLSPVQNTLGQIEGKLRALNTILQQRMDRRMALTELLQDIAVAANHALSVNIALQFAVNRICRHTGWPVGHVYLANAEASGELAPTDIWYLASREPFEAFRQITATYRLVYGDDLPGKVLATREPVWIPDVTQDPDFKRAGPADNSGLKAGFAFPVLVGDDVAAVLEFFSTKVAEPDVSLLEVMKLVGAQLGRVAERQRAEDEIHALNAELEQRVIERTAQLEVVNQELMAEINERRRAEAVLQIRARQQFVVANLGRLALGGIGLPELMAEVVRQVASTLEVEYCKVLEFLPTENVFIVRAGRGWEEGVVGCATVEASLESQAGYTLLFDEPVIVTNLPAETRFKGMPLLHEHGVVSGMTVVIPGRERPYGILGAHTAVQRIFTQDSANFLQAVANVLAAAIERKQVEEALKLSRDQNAELYTATQQLNTELEERVKARTLELQAANSQLEAEIAERKQAEIQIREHGQQLAEAQRIAHLGSWIWDIETDKVTWSDELYRIYGLNPAQFIPSRENFMEKVHPGDRDRVRQVIEEALEQSRSFTFEHRIVRSHGDVRVIYGWGQVLTNQSGQPVKMTGTAQDITEQKEIQAEVVELQRQLMEGQEAERLRLAQELHDGPLQDLQAMNMRLSELETNLSDETNLSRMVAVQAGLQRVAHALRAICGELRPPTLAPFGLEKAIRSHAEGFQKESPEIILALDLMPDGQTLPEQIRLALFRIYQHAMTNISQHAQAQHVSVRFKLEPRQIVLEIEDDGRGFVMPRRPIELVRQGHYGVVGAIERAESVGGSIRIISSPGQGTLLQAIIPRSNEQESGLVKKESPQL